jgi:hypothetical protein
VRLAKELCHQLCQGWDNAPYGGVHVSVRALILALARFEIASKDQTGALENAWAAHRKPYRLDVEERISARGLGELPALKMYNRVPGPNSASQWSEFSPAATELTPVAAYAEQWKRETVQTCPESSRNQGPVDHS